MKLFLWWVIATGIIALVLHPGYASGHSRTALRLLILWSAAAALLILVLHPTYDTFLRGMGEQPLQSQRAWIWEPPQALTDMDRIRRRDGETASFAFAIVIFFGVAAISAGSDKNPPTSEK